MKRSERRRKDGPPVLVVTASHNRRETTLQFARRLAAQTYKNKRLVLVDDGSTDGTAEAVVSVLRDTKLIRGHGSWWWGGSMHQAYLWIASQNLDADSIVLLINDDTSFDRSFIQNAVQTLKGHKDAALLAVARSESGAVLERGYKINWTSMRFRAAMPGESPDAGTTRGLFLRLHDYIALGGFHPWILPHYGSDIEYTIRIRRTGREIIVDDKVYLTMDTAATGQHAIARRSPIAYIRDLFKKTTSHNPVYNSILVLLAWPWHAKAPALLKIWLLPLVELMGRRRPALY